jgi:hypothetical protein
LSKFHISSLYGQFLKGRNEKASRSIYERL